MCVKRLNLYLVKHVQLKICNLNYLTPTGTTLCFDIFNPHELHVYSFENGICILYYCKMCVT